MHNVFLEVQQTVNEIYSTFLHMLKKDINILSELHGQNKQSALAQQ